MRQQPPWGRNMHEALRLSSLKPTSTFRADKAMMNSDSTTCILPPSRDEDFGPTTLVLSGKTITTKDAPSTSLYRLTRELTFAAPKHTTITFQRLENSECGDSDSTSSSRLQTQDLFYLVHPTNAHWREDFPEYYMTSVSPNTIGNVQFDISKRLLQKADFKAVLNSDKSAADTPLFDRESQQMLFDIKPKWKGEQYQWIDADGRKIAYEPGKSNEQTLVLMAPLQEHVKDALVALWVLRLWHDVAESKTARREGKIVHSVFTDFE